MKDSVCLIPDLPLLSFLKFPLTKLLPSQGKGHNFPLHWRPSRPGDLGAIVSDAAEGSGVGGVGGVDVVVVGDAWMRGGEVLLKVRL